MLISVWNKETEEYLEYSGVTYIANIGLGGDNTFKLCFKDPRKMDKVFNRDTYDLDFIHEE